MKVSVQKGSLVHPIELGMLTAGCFFVLDVDPQTDVFVVLETRVTSRGKTVRVAGLSNSEVLGFGPEIEVYCVRLTEVEVSGS